MPQMVEVQAFLHVKAMFRYRNSKTYLLFKENPFSDTEMLLTVLYPPFNQFYTIPCSLGLKGSASEESRCSVAFA